MMDSNLQNIILGVIANGLTSFIGHLWKKGKDVVVGNELQKKLKTKKSALQPILKKAIDAVAESIDLTGKERMEEISLFLSSSEVESIIRQVYSVHLSEDHKSNNLELIQQEFITSLSFYTGIEKKDKITASAKKFFEAMIEATEKALAMAIDEGILSAHEAKSMFRHRIILDEIASIQKNLDFLTSPVKIPVQSILEFEKKYREQVGARHKYIIPPNFDEAKNQPIDSLYVKPNFEYIAQKREEESKTINHSEFLSISYRTVILGNPGAGKCFYRLTKLSPELFQRAMGRSSCIAKI